MKSSKSPHLCKSNRNSNASLCIFQCKKRLTIYANERIIKLQQTQRCVNSENLVSPLRGKRNRGGEKHATDMVDHKRYLDCIAIEKRLRTESGDAAPVRESLCIQCYFHFDLGVKR